MNRPMKAWACWTHHRGSTLEQLDVRVPYSEINGNRFIFHCDHIWDILLMFSVLIMIWISVFAMVMAFAYLGWHDAIMMNDEWTIGWLKLVYPGTAIGCISWSYSYKNLSFIAGDLWPFTWRKERKKKRKPNTNQGTVKLCKSYKKTSKEYNHFSFKSISLGCWLLF